MRPLITSGRIRLQQEAGDWTQAVRDSAALLLADGCIAPEYVDAIFASFVTNGDYMIVMPEIVLAHARPESGALVTGISLVTLNRPVLFRDDVAKPIVAIFTLAAADAKEHIAMMQHLALILVDSEATQTIKSSRDVDTILNLLASTES
ncbi:MAG: PTS sugar transporter subunit IIA [Rhodoglobus sp.]